LLYYIDVFINVPVWYGCECDCMLRLATLVQLLLGAFYSQP